MHSGGAVGGVGSQGPNPLSGERRAQAPHPLSPGTVLVLSGEDVRRLLLGEEHLLADVVRDAYLAHRDGETVLPHSSFLRLPLRSSERAIALPAYLGGRFQAMGIKWIASFPENPRRGLERASGIVILNSVVTGRPIALLEGSLVSVKRTAASAALAARLLLPLDSPAPLGLIGCGPVNLEVLSFLSVLVPEIESVIAFDTSIERAQQFGARCGALVPALPVSIAPRLVDVLEQASVVSIATTAARPHIFSLGARPPAVILHLSLRDLAPQVVLRCANLVDDVDHVCRAETSLQLVEQVTGDRAFIDGSLGEFLATGELRAPAKRRTTVFSPFGLGILDIAVGQVVFARALERGVGMLVPNFFPRNAI